MYIVGASGVGKDSLIEYVRQHLQAQDRVLIAHRYITRDAFAGHENHVQLSAQEFALRARHELFAMHWESHGYRYGIGTEINAWLASGCAVVVNGSREYLSGAFERYPDMLVVWVSASQETVAARLLTRGRESSPQISQRLQRGPMAASSGDPRIFRIANEGALSVAGEQLLAIIQGAPNPDRPAG